jgi:hypothetical protein
MGRQIVTVWHADGRSGTSGGPEGSDVARAVQLLKDEGAVITKVGYPPANHYVIGVGVGHQDADFAERGDSMAAYYENGEAFGGRWWEPSPYSYPTGARKVFAEALAHDHTDWQEHEHDYIQASRVLIHRHAS